MQFEAFGDVRGLDLVLCGSEAPRPRDLLWKSAGLSGQVLVSGGPGDTFGRVDWTARATTDWLLVDPLFVALGLAQDPDRGSEVLAAWDPPGRWQRVW